MLMINLYTIQDIVCQADF